MPHRVLAFLMLCVLASLARAGVTFSVKLDPKASANPASGRLIIMLVKDGSKVPTSTEPLKGPFWDDPQPMFGMDVAGLAPGSQVTLDNSATAFPMALADLPPGQYRAQARLDTVRTNSEWKRDAGNLSSGAVKFTVDASDKVVELVLDKSTTVRAPRARQGVELFTMKSELLSAFYGKEFTIKAGVAYPLAFDPSRTYAAIYHSPGYGGDSSDAFRQDRSSVVPGSAEETLSKNTFMIYLDPESPFGNTLHADSANNGPWARSLVTELIPALEARYKLIATPAARMLQGHSSGGWSTLWLALNYPQTFGATWSTSPDPVDFRKFQVIDIYSQPNFYYAPGATTGDPAAELSSYRKKGEQRMTIRQENRMEEVIGPDNTSAQQWDSWFAAFGPRGEKGHPMALFDPATGEINHAVAEQYRAYDIGHLLRTEPEKYLPIFRANVRIQVGDQDNFSLNEAVALLKADVDRLSAERKADPGPGYIKILPGFDHGTIMAAPEMRRIPQEMLDHLKSMGIIAK